MLAFPNFGVCSVLQVGYYQVCCVVLNCVVFKVCCVLQVGYCQGLSFLAAALLLHMPEEQAFNLLVKIMFKYGLRDLFKQGFWELHLKFYMLER